MRAYEYRHVVSFEETSLMGSVYYTHHLRWQGRCREMFLREHAPGVLDALRDGLQLVTLRCSCEYHAEVLAADVICVRMSLAAQEHNRLTLHFEYVREGDGGEERVARGEQEIGCMRKVDGKLHPEPVPEALREALRPYGGR